MRPAAPPRVSVIVPNYRHAPYLPRRLDSILAQTCPDWELIILDDASPDESVSVISRYTDDARVRFLPSTTNSGDPFKQWQKGLELAAGDYVWIAESDDYADPAFLDKLLALAARHPTAGIVYCQSLMVDENDAPLFSLLQHYEGLEPVGRWENDFFAKGRDEVARYFPFRNTVPNASACLFRRDALARAGGPALGYRLCGDWLTYARILEHSDIAFCAETLNFYRLHHATARRSAEKAVLETIETYEVLNEIATRTSLEPDTHQLSAARTFERFLFLLQQSGLFELPDWPRLHKAARQYDPLFDLRLAAPAAWRPHIACVFFDPDGHFREEQTHRCHFPPGAPCTLRFGPCFGRFRLDPTSADGLISLFALNVRNPAGEVLWSANAANGYAGLELSGTCVRLPSSPNYVILAWGVDPIVLTPGFTPASRYEPYFVEVQLSAGITAALIAGAISSAP